MTDQVTRMLEACLGSARSAGRRGAEPDAVDEAVRAVMPGVLPAGTVLAAETAGVVLHGTAPATLCGRLPLLRMPEHARRLVLPTDSSPRPALVTVVADDERVRIRRARPPVPTEWAEVSFDTAPGSRLDVSPDRAGRLVAVALLARAAYLWGVARGALDLALTRGRERRQFGVPLAANQSVAFRLAAHHARLAAADALLDEVVESAADDQLHARAVAALRHTGRLARAVSTFGLHLHGAFGLTAASPAHRYYLYALLNAARPDVPTSPVNGSDPE